MSKDFVCLLNREMDELLDDYAKRRIADLEAKLAESKEFLIATKWKVQDLEQQLAEKEKERHEEWKTGKEWKWEWQKVNYKLEKANQDKISFAVEQLKKVKECLYKIQSPIGEKPTLMDDGDVFEVINNQIKELKEMK